MSAWWRGPAVVLAAVAVSTGTVTVAAAEPLAASVPRPVAAVAEQVLAPRQDQAPTPAPTTRADDQVVRPDPRLASVTAPVLYGALALLFVALCVLVATAT